MKKIWPKLNIIFLLALAMSLLVMQGKGMSDDQITYAFVAESLFGLTEYQTYWGPDLMFSTVLGLLRLLLGNFYLAYIVIYIIVSLLYLNAMAWCLGYFFKSWKVVTALTLISWVPRYTMAMTYWGFAGFEYIRGRILIMPLTCIVLRLYFEWMNTRKVWVPLALCASGGFLNFEIYYLFLILVLHQTIYFLIRKDLKALWRLMQRGLLLVIVMIGIYMIRPLHILLRSVPDAKSAIDYPYESIVRANQLIFDGMAVREYMNLFWEAAYAAFWWTLFPPRLSDMGFALLNAGFLIPFALWGIWLQKKGDKKLFSQNLIFMLCCLALAYGYQIVRVVGWKLFSWPPEIWEEVRAVKFMYFSLFLFAGSCLAWTIRKKKVKLFWMACVLMLIPPLGALRSLPAQAKHVIYERMAPWLASPAHLEYLEKVLQTQAKETHLDVAGMLEALNEGERALILSDLHAIKTGGYHSVISYQDKRIYKITIDDQKHDRLPHWYYAYREIQSALERAEPQELYLLTNKYNCRYVITERPIDDWRFAPRFHGERYHLYEVVN